MNDLPTLIVYGDTTWVQAAPDPEWPFVVRVDGDLPMVFEPMHPGPPYRSLRDGDRVTLATVYRCPGDGDLCGGDEPHDMAPVPFATATVTNVIQALPVNGQNRWIVTVNEIEGS